MHDVVGVCRCGSFRRRGRQRTDYVGSFQIVVGKGYQHLFALVVAVERSCTFVAARTCKLQPRCLFVARLPLEAHLDAALALGVFHAVCCDHCALRTRCADMSFRMYRREEQFVVLGRSHDVICRRALGLDDTVFYHQFAVLLGACLYDDISCCALLDGEDVAQLQVLISGVEVDAYCILGRLQLVQHDGLVGCRIDGRIIQCILVEHLFAVFFTIMSAFDDVFHIGFLEVFIVEILVLVVAYLLGLFLHDFFVYRAVHHEVEQILAARQQVANQLGQPDVAAFFFKIASHDALQNVVFSFCHRVFQYIRCP